MSTSWTKDPDDVLDFSIDWTAWLAAVEDTITTATWAVESGDVEIDGTDRDGGLCTVWLSGGTEPTRSSVRCRIVTTGGRTADKTMTLTVRTR